MYNIAQLPLLFLQPDINQAAFGIRNATGRNWDHHFLAAFTQYVDSVKQPDGSVIKEYVIFD